MTPTLLGRHTGRVLDADDMIGAYGAGTSEWAEDGEHFVVYRTGLLSEHVPAFVAAGGTVRDAASGSGRSWAVRSFDRLAIPVVCSEIIPVMTEDGPSDGRCGLDALVEGSCEGHAAERKGYFTPPF